MREGCGVLMLHHALLNEVENYRNGWARISEVHILGSMYGITEVTIAMPV